MTVRIGKIRGELVERKCIICGKDRKMDKMERFCSQLCRNQATSMDKFGIEYKIMVR